MSLRVLLADESASIRKVFQMGLQDFGAEIKSVHNGLDVVEVAQSYKPDIIFADILLQKKNGYEVATELQEHGDLGNVPVILMWSSFMELDQSKYQASGAKGELEKPFDVDKMRDIIRGHVSTTQSQQLSGFLSFPQSITSEFVEEEEAKSKGGTTSVTPGPTGGAGIPSFSVEDGGEAPAIALETDPTGEQPLPETPPAQDVEKTSEFNMQAEDSDFQMYEVPSQTPAHQMAQTEEQKIPPENEIPGNWEAKPLNDNTLTESQNSEGDLDNFQSMDLGNEKKMNLDDFLYKPGTNTEPPPVDNMTAATGEIHNINIPNYDNNTQPAASLVTPEEAEAIIRAETRAMITQVIREQLPAMLEKVVKEELEKVLQQEMALKNPGQSPG